MMKHLVVLIVAALVGLISVAWLIKDPPRHPPPHPSYLPEK
ncbi:hypothetical protein ACFPN2_26055 [Steroidobacter flavus]|uniref:Uncharacterized protein n=1 Tax=Steroidobacter flavus TaxID=1842136 RepID=A0ABV8SYA5_9GAMM